MRVFHANSFLKTKVSNKWYKSSSRIHMRVSEVESKANIGPNIEI